MLVTNVKVENIVLVFGCPPAVGVKAKTEMIYDLANAMEQGYNKDKFSLIIPDVFERLEGNDAAFEMIQSNTL